MMLMEDKERYALLKNFWTCHTKKGHIPNMVDGESAFVEDLLKDY